MLTETLKGLQEETQMPGADLRFQKLITSIHKIEIFQSLLPFDRCCNHVVSFFCFQHSHTCPLDIPPMKLMLLSVVCSKSLRQPWGWANSFTLCKIIGNSKHLFFQSKLKSSTHQTLQLIKSPRKTNQQGQLDNNNSIPECCSSH